MMNGEPTKVWHLLRCYLVYALLGCAVVCKVFKPQAFMHKNSGLARTSILWRAFATSAAAPTPPSRQHRNHAPWTSEAPEAAVSASPLAARQAQRCLRPQGQPGSAQVEGLHALDRLHSQPVRLQNPSMAEQWSSKAFVLTFALLRSLKYALNARETKAIVMQRLIKVDGKVRTDPTYPAGFMDVIGIEKTGENFRLVYDTKGRFTVHRITAEEAEYKLGKVKRVQLGKGGIPFLVTHDART